jgi:hypothetical protein
MSQPVQVGELLPEVLAEVIQRAGNRYDRWAEQVAATGYCAHPVRLRGWVEQVDQETGDCARSTRPSGSRMPRC